MVRYLPYTVVVNDEVVRHFERESDAMYVYLDYKVRDIDVEVFYKGKYHVTYDSIFGEKWYA